jgi:hypothetical protein
MKTLIGYPVTHSGKEFIFRILTNGSGVSAGPVRAGINRVVEAVARH